MKKRAQITFFVIFGVVILILVLFSFHLRSTGEKAKGEAEVQKQLGFQSRAGSVKDHILSCAETVLAQAIVSKGLSETEISEYINENLALCTDFSMFKGMKITAGSVSSNVFKTSDEESINAEIDFPVTIEQDSSSAKLNDFYASYDLIAGTKLPIDINCVVTEDVTAYSSNKGLELKIPSGVKAVMPDGSCVNDVEIKLVDVSGATLGKLNYNLEPDGAVFDTPLTLIMEYDDENDDGIVDGMEVDEDDLKISMHYYPPSYGWVMLPTTVDTVNNIILTSVKHFTEFGIEASNGTNLAYVYLNGTMRYPNIYPDGEPELVELRNLDDSGCLNGKYVTILNVKSNVDEEQGTAPPPVVCKSDSKTGEDFIFGPEIPPNYLPNGQRFDQVSQYFYYDLFATYYFYDVGFDKRLIRESADGTREEFGLEVIVGLYGPSGGGGYKVGSNLITSERPQPGIPHFPRFIGAGAHEYAHYASIITSSALSKLGEGGEGEALAEGYAIYSSQSFLRDSLFGYNTQYELNDTIVFDPNAQETEEHGRNINWAISFASTLWGLRSWLGQETADRIAFASFRTLTQPTFEAAVPAFVEADKQLYNGEHRNDIIRIFKEHGIVCEHCIEK